jgi:hypothetical protein
MNRAGKAIIITLIRCEEEHDSGLVLVSKELRRRGTETSISPAGKHV